MIDQQTLTVTAILAIFTITLPHKYFLIPFVLAVCFIPTDQRIIIMDLDFTVLRILIVASVLRIFLRNEQKIIKWNKFDKLLLAWAFCGAVVYLLLWHNIQTLIYKSGVLFDIIGLYWLFRQSIRSWIDVKLILKAFAVCALLLAPIVALEWSTGRNPFIIFGRVWTSYREGRFRCQAAFPHSIMFGVFWANLLPIFICYAMAERRKVLFWLATAAGLFMVMASNSSTPIGTLGVNLLLLAGFRFRMHGRLIALGLCAMTAALHVVMKAPVWHLISRVSIVRGSTGWHRYYLIDQTIRRFHEWALLGTHSTAHWGRSLFDITNQYSLEAVRGGLITLILFVLLLIMAVRDTGRYSLQKIPTSQQWLAWGICVSILGHCVSFIGVSYFGQIHMLLYLTFAIVGLIYEMSTSSLHFDRYTNPVSQTYIFSGALRAETS